VSLRSFTFSRGLAAIVLGGLVLRVIYAYAIVRSAPLNGDALEFEKLANLIGTGHGFIQPFTYDAGHVAQATADKPPLYPTLEAAISFLGGRTWAWHDIVGILAGTSTVGVVGLLGRRVAGARTGLIAAGIAAVYPLLIAADGSLRSEPLSALLVTLVLLTALGLREAPSVRRALLVGALIGLAALNRGEAVLLLALPFALAGMRRGGFATLACVAVLAPWFIRCWVVFDQPVFISTNVGGLLAGANCDATYYGGLLGQWYLGCLPTPHHKNEAQASNELRRVGLTYASHHKSRLPVVLAARLGRSFELYRPRQNADIEHVYEGRSLRVEQAGVLMYYVLALLAMGGVVVLRRRDGPWGVLLSPFVLVVVVSLTAYGFTRFRISAEPALVVLAAVALDALLRRRSGPSGVPA
jgi:4-amino-4-deoxy-L-arabinose transferase-like glycosyltransferase